MEIWKRILGKGKSQVPDSLTTSDWLHNMSDVFLQCGVEVLQKNPSSPALLAYFTLLNSTISTYNILHLMPDTHSKVGEIFREFRLYYDCLWQNCLLERYNSESEKVSHLYAWVDLQFVGILKSVFEQNPNIKRLLQSSIERDYYNRLTSAVKIYIHGEYSAFEKANDFEELLGKNIDSITLRLAYICSKRQDRNLVEAIKKQIIDDLDRSIKMTLLTRFDFANCNVIQFPDEFLQ